MEVVNLNNLDRFHVVVNRYCQHLSTFARVIHVDNMCVKLKGSGPFEFICLSIQQALTTHSFIWCIGIKLLLLLTLSLPRESHPKSGLDLGTSSYRNSRSLFSTFWAGTDRRFCHFLRLSNRAQPACNTCDRAQPACNALIVHNPLTTRLIVHNPLATHLTDTAKHASAPKACRITTEISFTRKQWNSMDMRSVR
jgi:hypothetical protein